jgi:hypothetical protein
MKKFIAVLGFALAGPLMFAAEPAPELPATPGWSYTELSRMPAAEARQGVVADDDYLYAINNFSIGKYLKKTGERVALWACEEGKPLTHVNAGVLYQGKLYGAHSNYPGVPMLSSVEIWDTKTMKHVGSHSFGRADGSLTWVDRRNGRWIACFVHYGKKGGEPGRGPEWTRIVEFDDEWRPTSASWVLPADLMAHIAGGGYSCSGGAFGPGGFLYVTGHDNTELYVLQFPDAGPALEWVATFPVAAQGQAFGWDPKDKDVIHMLSRGSKEIVSGRVTMPKDAKAR